MIRDNVESLYLGWRTVAHRQDCARPSWTAEHRETSERRDGRTHECPDVDCGHNVHADVLTVRLLCPSCGVVRIFRGDARSEQGTTTDSYGYGQAPRKVGGLFLYPGSLRESWGPAPAAPDQYLVTAVKAERITPDNLLGRIGSGVGPRGGIIWSAGVHPRVHFGRPDGLPFIVCDVVSGDVTFRTPTAAARWIADQPSGAPAQDHPAGTQSEQTGTVR